MSSCPSPGLVCCKTLRSWQSISSGRVPLWMIWSWSLGRVFFGHGQVASDEWRSRFSRAKPSSYLPNTFFFCPCASFLIFFAPFGREFFFLPKKQNFALKFFHSYWWIEILHDENPDGSCGLRFGVLCTNMSRIQFHLFFLKMKIISKLGSKDLLRKECLRSADPPSSWTKRYSGWFSLNMSWSFVWDF